MTSSKVLVNKEHPGITILTLNRPEKRNALSVALLKEFCIRIDEAQQDPTIRVILLSGAGPVFCAGLDLQEVNDPLKEEESAHLITDSLKKLYELSKVTIAAVHGAALAGGAGVMSACDFVVAASDVRCGFPEVRRGLVPAQVSAILHRQLSWRHVRELLLLGEIMDADQAKALGLINKIVPPTQVMAEALKYAQIVQKGAPGAIKETKRLLEELYPDTLEHALTLTTPYHHASRRSKEAVEGTRAFFEKRDPLWEC